MKSMNFPYNPQIDQLRFIAAILVFSFHFQLEVQGLGGNSLQGAWWGLITQGHTGVGLFFTLSGFLFMQIAFNSKGIEFSPFIRNRFLRIFPLFFTIFLLATSIGRDRFIPSDIFYLLASNLGMAPTSYTVITGAAWCISLEFLFYVLFPALSRIAIIQGPKFLVRLVALMIFFKLAAFTVSEKSDLMYFSTFVGRFDQFLIGMLAAFMLRQFEAAIKKRAGWWLFASLGLVIFNSSLQAYVAPFNASAKTHFWIFWSIIESTGWSVFIVAWTTKRDLLPNILSTALQAGGKVSFSFYLLHMAVIHIWARLVGLHAITGFPNVDIGLTAVLIFGLTCLLSNISFETIEAPFLQMRRNYST
jgi:peptidoglycan/LPS O-acetylase OafA/YrhL